MYSVASQCLEDHCPSSALDWVSDASADLCKAEVNNVAGFISRKRPVPQYDISEAYYQTALAVSCPLSIRGLLGCKPCP